MFFLTFIHNMKQKRVFKKSKSLKNSLDEEIQLLRSKYETIPFEKDVIKSFQDFPLSHKTLRGLKDANYIKPTAIQSKSIGPALQGKDVLGAAITGSGKTLAFLIPTLERLYMAKWSRTDGAAAVIISPTRELAYQIFETLKKIGKYHDFSAGLIIGGKNLKFEQRRMDQCNILICTPGRLLQHMDENPLFNTTTVELLVLDEADRCLDLGFEQTLNAIVENLPTSKQTLLFSATQTNSLKDLARLNLKDPVCIGQSESVDETRSNMNVVPDLLQQNYVVVELEDKITMLWSFIKNHLKLKIIVFLSSCKQVKYVYEIFCKLRPGTSLLALYGTLHQDRRIAIYNDFVRKSNVVLFATDIASRGLDFPSVNWVVQLDCPEDVNQYIHRAGRSARNEKHGECLLVLMPSEEDGMIDELKRKCLTVRKIQIDSKKLFSPRAKIEAFLAQNTELKASAQRAFVAYIKSIFLMKNKKIFNVLSLNFDAFAKSLGLVVTPRVRFLDRYLKKQNDNNDEIQAESNFVSDEASEKKVKTEQLVSKQIKKFENDEILFKATNRNTDSEESDDDFIKIRRANHEIMDNEQSSYNDGIDSIEDLPPPIPRKKNKLITKAGLAKKVLKKKLQMNEKLKFDEEGHEIVDPRKQLQSNFSKEIESKELSSGGINIEMVKQLLQEEDKFDKQRFRSLVKQRHKGLKEKLKKQNINKTACDENENDVCSDDDTVSVDLSWLPDPSTFDNKKLNRTTASDEDVAENYNTITEGSSSADELQSQEFDEPLTKKSKVTSKLTLNDAEVIATQLLFNNM